MREFRQTAIFYWRQQLTLKTWLGCLFLMPSDISLLADSLFKKLEITPKVVDGRREGTSDEGIYVSYWRKGDETLSLALRKGPGYLEHLVLWKHGGYSAAGYVSDGPASPLSFSKDSCVSMVQTARAFLKSFLENCSGAETKNGMVIHSQYVPSRHFPVFSDYFVQRFSGLLRIAPVAGSR